MPEDNTELLTESRLRGALPDGWKTTLYDEEHLRQLEQSSPEEDLTNVVDDYSGNAITERDIVTSEVQRFLTAFVTPERTMELPGTGLELENGHLTKFAALYKSDNETPSGTITDPRRAGPDDIVFTFASPEVYEEISGQTQASFDVTGVSADSTVELIGDNGLNVASPGADTTLQLDDNEMLYFTGDFIDLSDGQSVLTKFQWADIDGKDYGPTDSILSTRFSGLHTATAQGALAKSTVDLDAKAYAAGDAELVPVAFYMAPGTKAPSLS